MHTHVPTGDSTPPRLFPSGGPGHPPWGTAHLPCHRVVVRIKGNKEGSGSHQAWHFVGRTGRVCCG